MKDLDFQCPACGAEVHPNARGCRKCGARRDGKNWVQPEIYDGLQLPGTEDDDFDYEAFIAEEFGEGPKRGWRNLTGRQIFWWIAAVVTLLAFIFAFAIWPPF